MELNQQTLLDMLYYMKLTREIETRIERKLYRQGRSLAVFMSDAVRKPLPWVLAFSLRKTTASAHRIAIWEPF